MIFFCISLDFECPKQIISKQLQRIPVWLYHSINHDVVWRADTGLADWAIYMYSICLLTHSHPPSLANTYHIVAEIQLNTELKESGDVG